MKEYLISITCGRSRTYYPHSVEALPMDGELEVGAGKVKYIDKLCYYFAQWTQATEVCRRIYDSEWALPTNNSGPDMRWRSDVVPGTAGTLEGLRLLVSGNENTAVTLKTASADVYFTLGELSEKERLSFHAGGKYTGFQIDVFLGADARMRVSRRAFLRGLNSEAGAAVLPEDFTAASKTYFHSMYGAVLPVDGRISAIFTLYNYHNKPQNGCAVRIQLAAVIGYDKCFGAQNVCFTVRVNGFTQKIDRVYTNRLFLPKLEDIYFSIPWEELTEKENAVEFVYNTGKSPLVIHRVYFNAPRPTLTDELKTLPPLPKARAFHTGFETDLLTPENGDVDRLLDVMNDEELGDYVFFRERTADCPADDLLRFGKKAAKYNFYASSAGSGGAASEELSKCLGKRYLGFHGHEQSSLLYGWGDAEPLDARKTRTLPECRDSYLKRMSHRRTVGQAIPMQALDYESGVEYVMTEIPGCHCTLALCGARGAAAVYNKKEWGVHVACHVQSAPIDLDCVRRLFIVTAQSRLFGASFVYDEEVALRYNHDTLYAYSDEIPTAYRRIYQSLYHFANAVTLGEPVVNCAFLLGNLDALVGGAIAGPYTKRPKIWGQIGRETDAWEYNTPEAGWKLTDTFLPGVHLYPIEQDTAKIRYFFSGTPYGQIDIVPINASAEKLSRYPLLILPGWNTMTSEIYDSLIGYAEGGGTLLLCAAQCTTHITREFLLEKEDFAFIYDGDLSALCGVRVSAPEGIVNTVRFADKTVYTAPGVRGLHTELRGAKIVASDQSGKPVLTENRVGKGRVFTLTVGEYWGHPALAELNRLIVGRLAEKFRGDIYLEGDTSEVDFHLYKCGTYTRAVLLNTDWTSAENVKYVTLNAPGIRCEIAVREGRTTHVLIKDSFALSFNVPFAVVDNLEVSKTNASFRVGGRGIVNIRLYSESEILSVSSDAGISFDGESLSAALGNEWSEAEISIEKSM